MPLASSCQLRRGRSEAPHEGSVRQARQIAEPLDAEQRQPFDNLRFDARATSSGSGASSSLSEPGAAELPSATYAAARAAILFVPAPSRNA